MSDKVQFQTNIPVEIALKYGEGKEVSGQYGDQVMYTLTDERVMYVPPIVKRRIENSESDEASCSRSQRRRRRTERGGRSSGWLLQENVRKGPGPPRS